MNSPIGKNPKQRLANRSISTSSHYRNSRRPGHQGYTQTHRLIETERETDVPSVGNGDVTGEVFKVAPVGETEGSRLWTPGPIGCSEITSSSFSTNRGGADSCSREFSVLFNSSSYHTHTRTHRRTCMTPYTHTHKYSLTGLYHVSQPENVISVCSVSANLPSLTQDRMCGTVYRLL